VYWLGLWPGLLFIFFYAAYFSLHRRRSSRGEAASLDEDLASSFSEPPARAGVRAVRHREYEIFLANAGSCHNSCA